MGKYFAEMSSRTALAWYTVMNLAFRTKSMKRDSFGTFIMKILNFKSDCRKCMYEEIQRITTRYLENWV